MLTKTYLPKFLQEYVELALLCESYDEQLKGLFDNIQIPLKVLNFDNIDEVLVSYFEYVFDVPYREKSLEDRAKLIKLLLYTEDKYNEYTFKTVLEDFFGKLDMYTDVSVYGHDYPYLSLSVNLENKGDTDILRYIIDRYVPANVYVESSNSIQIDGGEYKIYTADVVNTLEKIEIGGNLNGEL